VQTVFTAIAVAIAACISCGPASAQQPYPAKPVRMVIGFPPGGGTDIVGRIVAQKLTEAWGQQVTPDNRGGAAGQIGTDIVAHAQPDGYTMLMAHIAALAILPSLVAKLPYDPARDFAPVALCAIAPNLLVIHPSIQVLNVRELIQIGRARPGELRFASSGAGSLQHLAGELFKLQAKIDMLHVPYKGSGQAVVDLIAGQVHMNFDSVPAVLPHVKSGKLRALAVTTEKRFSLLPKIPTVAESGGLKGFDVSTWWGLVVPAGVNRDIIARIHAATVKLLQQPDVRDTMNGVGAEIAVSSPERFAEFIRSEREKYSRIIREANVKLD
jgi:tripartite-type tricarboxylate transporter receptor subunit TctC